MRGAKPARTKATGRLLSGSSEETKLYVKNVRGAGAAAQNIVQSMVHLWSGRNLVLLQIDCAEVQQSSC